MRRLLHVSEYFLPDYTAGGPLAGEVRTKLYGGRVFYAAAEAHPGEVRASNLGRRLEGNGLLPPSITLTTRLHGGGRGNPAASFASYSYNV